MKITQEMIDKPYSNAVLVNYGDGVAMAMEIVKGYNVYFGVEKDQQPEDVEYSISNIIDNDDRRGD